MAHSRWSSVSSRDFVAQKERFSFKPLGNDILLPVSGFHMLVRLHNFSFVSSGTKWSRTSWAPVLFPYRTFLLSPEHQSSREDSGGWLWMRRAGRLASQEWMPLFATACFQATSQQCHNLHQLNVALMSSADFGLAYCVFGSCWCPKV